MVAITRVKIKRVFFILFKLFIALVALILAKLHNLTLKFVKGSVNETNSAQNYFTPCINFFRIGFIRIDTKPTAIGINVKIRKNELIEYSSEILSIIPPMVPAAF